MQDTTQAPDARGKILIEGVEYQLIRIGAVPPWMTLALRPRSWLGVLPDVAPQPAPWANGSVIVHHGRRGPAGPSDKELRQVADIYNADISGSPTEAVRLALNLSGRTASRWVSRARDRGYLPPYQKERVSTENPKSAIRSNKQCDICGTCHDCPHCDGSERAEDEYLPICPIHDDVKQCTVVVGTHDERCGKKPASPMPEAAGTWFDFPMCAEHQELFRKGAEREARAEQVRVPNE